MPEVSAQHVGGRGQKAVKSEAALGYIMRLPIKNKIFSLFDCGRTSLRRWTGGEIQVSGWVTGVMCTLPLVPYHGRSFLSKDLSA